MNSEKVVLSATYRLAVCALLLLIAIQAISSMSVKSPVYDELKWLETARREVSNFEWLSNASVLHPPLSLYIHGILLKPFKFTNPQNWLFAARLLMVPFALLAGAYVFRWARELYGDLPGLVALFLFTFSPNILAHSRFLTTDMLPTCFGLMGLYYFWKSFQHPARRNVVLAGIFLGMALLSKYSTVIFVPIYVLVGLLSLFCRPSLFQEEDSLGKKLYASTGRILVALVLALLVFNAGYGFEGTFTPLRNYRFYSGLSALSDNSLIGSLPFPLPAPFMLGIDYVRVVTEWGHPAFLMGKVSMHSWRYFFLIAYLIKTPIPALVLLFGSVVLFRRRKRSDLFSELVLILSAATIFLYCSFFSRTNSQFRYILPISPLVFIFVSNSVTLVGLRKRVAFACFAILFGWYLYGTLAVYPHYLAYFNEIVGGPNNGYKLMLDSNLDWGQDQELMKSFVKEQDELVTVVPGCMPVTGKIVINANNLHDLYRKRRDCHAWLRNFQPSGNVAYTWLVYDLSAEDFRQGAEQSPDDPQKLFELAAVFKSERKYSEALACLNRAISLRPNLSEAYALIGFIHMQTGRLPEAIGMYEKAAELDPLSVETHENLAFLRELTGDSQGADSDERNAVLARVLTSMAFDVPVDLAFHRERVDSDPSSPKPRNNLGFVYWKEGDLDSAIAEFQRATALDPYFVDAYANLAFALEEKGLLQPAIIAALEFERLRHLAVAHRDYRVYYGRSKLMMGDTFELPFRESATLRLRQQLRAEPQNASLRNLLGVSYLAMGEHARALREFRAAIGVDPGFPQPHLNLAMLYFEKGLYDKAAEEIEETLKISQDLAEAYRLHAEVRLRTGDFEGAVKQWETALAKGLTGPAAEDVWDKIEKIRKVIENRIEPSSETASPR